MKLWIKIAAVLLIIISGFLLQGCLFQRPKTVYEATCEDASRKPVFAVLMFNNLSSWERADSIIETLFVSALVKRGYPVIEPANIKKIYITSRASNKATAVTRVINPLAALYRVKYFITGSVLKYGFIKKGKKNVPFVSFNVKILNRDKKTVWKAYVEKKGTDYTLTFSLGEIRTPDLLAGLNIKYLVSQLCWSKRQWIKW